jgi:aminopeptidase-like protein
MAIISNLTIDQGSTFSVDIDVTDADGDALNLTDFTVQGQMRKTYTSSTATTFVSEITNATGGVVTISLTAATTNALKAGRYVYDVEITSPASVVTRIVEGQVEVTPGVTQV